MIRPSSTAERANCNREGAGSNPAAGTILSGHQPTYLPGIILFNKIALSDAFMFVGHCQFCPKSWHVRNHIRQGDGQITLTVPVQKSFGQSLDQTRIIANRWSEKHVKSIEQSYRKRPFFDVYFPGLYQLITWDDWESLSEMNMAIIATMMEWLHIETPVLESWEYNIEGHKTDMLISMCGQTGFPQYLSNEGSRAYVDENRMLEHGITHRWQKFTHPVYEQGHKFIPNLSAIDLLFNCGPDAGRIVKECGHVE